MNTEIAGHFFILLGGLFCISLVISPLARVLGVPRVTLLLLTGVGLGPLGLDLFSSAHKEWMAFIADFTLLIVGYLLGARLTPEFLAKYAKGVLFVSLVITVVTTCIVAGGLILLGVNASVAIILGAIAAATDPAAMLDILSQRKNSNSFGRMLEGVVAMDDILGLFVFSLALTLVGMIELGNGSLAPLFHLLYELFGSIFLGCMGGYIAAKLLNSKHVDQPVIVESLAFILLLGGGAKYFEVSFLLSAMIMGAVVVNVADKDAAHLHEIEEIEQPFLILFFIIAGAGLSFDSSSEVFYLFSLFVLLRIFGRFLGGWFAPKKYVPKKERGVIGLALLPQAGVAMGMALVASHQYPQYATIIVPVTITATVLFELLGPIITAKCLDYVRNSNA